MKRYTSVMMIAVGLVAGNHGRAVAQDQSPTPPPPKWESSAFAGLTLTRGNSDTLLFAANLKTQRKDKDNEWAFGADGAYGENNSVKNNEVVHGFGQYNRLFNERLFGYARLDATHDAIADIEYRVVLSPGLGYYLLKSKQTTLAGEAGPGVVFEKRGQVDDIYATLRVAERLEHKFNDSARIWQMVEWLPQVDRFGNYIVNAEIGVEASLAKKLALSVMLQDTYINEPAPGRENNDVKLISGITYKF